MQKVSNGFFRSFLQKCSMCFRELYKGALSKHPGSHSRAVGWLEILKFYRENPIYRKNVVKNFLGFFLIFLPQFVQRRLSWGVNWRKK